ncbi:MAG: CPBP family intramembrane metalloprotease [Bacteroidetes bacterium]|nr:CPBP family intramembrane metalloprotease [Bacteroidota bacterium]
MELKSGTIKFINFPLTKIIVGVAVLIIAMLTVQKFSQDVIKHFGLSNELKSLIAALLASAVALGSYYYLFKFYENRKIRELSFNRVGYNAMLGLSVGFGILSMVILIMYFGKAYSIIDFHPVSFLIPALAMAISSAIFEEVLFRGIIFRITEEKLGSVFALIISSSIFGFGHLANQNSTIFSAIAITMEAGVLLGAAYIYSRNLWLPIFIHFAWNFSEGGIYGTIISGNGLNKSLVTSKISGPELLTGGAFGPENSLQALLLGLVVGLLFLWMAKKQGKIIAPFWKHR